MTLSLEAVQRLSNLGYVTEDELRMWHEMWKSEGEEFVLRFLQKEEQAAQKYRLWLPRLKVYAAECRRAAPAPTLDALTLAEREQYRILLAKMRQFAASDDHRCVFGKGRRRAAILWTTKIGLAAAEQVFGHSGAIILEESERDRWISELCPIDEEAFSWYAFAWWTLTEDLPREDERQIVENYPIPDGSSYWVVVSGVQWGSLAGGAEQELWQWNGKTAELIGLYCVDSY